MPMIRATCPRHVTAIPSDPFVAMLHELEAALMYPSRVRVMEREAEQRIRDFLGRATLKAAIASARVIGPGWKYRMRWGLSRKSGCCPRRLRRLRDGATVHRV